MSNVAKNFDILTNSLSSNYFNGPIKYNFLIWI